MPPSWRDGLVNAFPIPQDRRKNKKGPKHIIAVSPVTVNATNEMISTGSEKYFPFVDLPAEIRNHIYTLVLFTTAGYRGMDGRKKSRTSILAVDKKMHLEAAYVLYSSQSFRIFPIQDFVPFPLVSELRPIYRPMVTQLEMTVGSSWTSPPKTWRVSKLLAKRLGRLTEVQTLNVFVTLDPSGPMFEKYSISPDFYTNFCGNLLRDVLVVVPHIKFVTMGGNPSIDSLGPLVTRLKAEAEAKGKSISMGKTRPLVTPDGLQMVFE
ncbi:uncharacterized protein A1O9_08163 [Exophiala aquamarina CBS 119918]|uniref:Uncharacterized protein n=1 Tax=Exophiala aquamarina CBS 119918 TaxID=1182545 RepID=A0A072P803_9EURO|nr:uncharacterized protein A1O9_08163 [Exophiala aquamarina CBS 119918]KEF55413.1 hypothetical protein A1O9_08163 [Exophiala aquamarina CBS 119918]